MTAVLELAGVVKEYAGVPPLRALDGVELDIAAGELTAVVGPSGSGKSTLLNIIGTLDRPTSGSVHLAQRDLTALDDRQLSVLRSEHIGFVFQQFHLLAGLDAIENVAMGLLYRGVPARERRRRAIDALDRVGLSARRHQRPSQLSGGEQQRVAIARAIVGEPAIVLADEPTGNLDSHNGADVLQLLRDLHAGGATIIVITHDQAIAASMPRCVTMKDGRVEWDRR
ncbi:MAG: putative transport system ATP-binding protein [Acidimicrobiaceae bacterium]|jgi:putative ABC transport system ATP-binding protein